MTGSTRRLLGSLAVVLCAGALATPGASANDIAPFTTVFQTDATSAGFGGMRSDGTGTLTVSGVTGTVTQALLYWQGPTNTTDTTANANVTFAGAPVTGTNIGLADDNCWDYANSHAYRADVTALVPGDGAYSLADFVKGPDVEVNGASLLVFFDDGNNGNDRDVVLFEGNDSNIVSPFDADGWNVSLSGINYTSGSAGIGLHVSDGQAFGNDEALTLNGQPWVPSGPNFQGDTVPGNVAQSRLGLLWDIRTYDVTSFLTPGPNSLTLKTQGPASDCLSLVVVAVDLPAGAAPREFTLDLDPPNATNPVGTDHTVTATLGDQDGPAGGEQILFDVTGANPTSGSATTEDDGTATFTWTGTDEGTDTVVACHDENGSGTCDRGELKALAEKIWEITRDGAFSCRATGLRVGTSEAGVANAPNLPCRDDGKTLIPAKLGTLPNQITANVVNGLTDSQPNDPSKVAPAVGDGSSAYASAANVSLVSGTSILKLALLEASATARCTATSGSTPALSADGRIVGLTLNGRNIATGTGTVTLPLGVATLYINKTDRTPNRITRRALYLDNLLLPDVVIAEAIADYTGRPCPRPSAP